MTWLSRPPYAVVDRRIREVLAERMGRGAKDELDQRLAALIEEQRRLASSGWFS